MEYNYKIYPLTYLYCYEVYKFLENSNKAIVPDILINDITNKYDDELVFPLYYKFKDIDMIFSYYESVIDIDGIYLPNHIFIMLNIEPGVSMTFNLLKNSLLKGTKCILQPHTSNFYEIEDYRNYLEKTFSENYTSLSENTTIQIPYFNDTITLDVIKTYPESNISIIDTDLEVSFEKALDYVEPPKLKKIGIGLSFTLNNKLVNNFYNK
jgi:hypothetical protein